MTDQEIFRPGDKVAQRGSYQCDSSCGHRWSTEVEGHQAPAIPQDCEGNGWVLADSESLDRGPGAHSGSEAQPQDRVVPGTGSATEGYEPPGGGTRHGDPLGGVSAPPPESDK